MDGYCSECREPCEEIKRNFGYGSTEYWGAVSTHDKWYWVSKCCDGEVLTKEELNELYSLSGGDE